MMCKKPYMKGVRPFGCGQCLPCRVNRNRIWSSRILLESMLHHSSVFVTLTYNDENLPPNGSVLPEHLKNFWKRLRRAIYPLTIRYFACGEYGEETKRPHYHAAIFGLSPLDEKIIGKCWPFGFIHVGDITIQSAQYISKYIQKGMTNGNSTYVTEKLCGRHPEFARMSLKPGIGADAVDKLGDFLETDIGCREISINNDVISSLKLGKRTIPLGKYIKEKLRNRYGFKGSPIENQEKHKKEMLILLSETRKEIGESEKFLSDKQVLQWLWSQKILQIEKRTQIKNSIKRRNS